MSKKENDTHSIDSGREIVRALSRGLAILRYVNAVGATKPGEIAHNLDIPRPTVYRLLRTLEEEGYIAFSSSSSCVRVTRFACSLGDGSALYSRLCMIAGPLFAEFAPSVVWPLDLSIYENASMVIQETTHSRSPMSIDRGMVGYKLPMLRSSAGRAYLGHCDVVERDIILAHIKRLDIPEDRSFLTPTFLEPMLKGVRQNGFAFRNAGEFRAKTSSIAMPIIVNDNAVACVSIIWISTAMTLTEAIKRYVQHLGSLASKFQSALEIQESE